jgi:deazaflavin-dependent oxidoreductase (nitroreductase family)
MSEQPTPTRYLEPDRFTRRVFNPLMAAATRLGVSVYGSRVLRVRGRSSGEWRTTPVNPLTLGSERYLVAPRGVTQWVRNLRAAGGGELALGRRVEAFSAEELDDEAKPEILRAYLTKWKFEVGQFFDGVGPDASEAELRRIAPGYPVFRIRPAAVASHGAAPDPPRRPGRRGT